MIGKRRSPRGNARISHAAHRPGSPQRELARWRVNLHVTLACLTHPQFYAFVIRAIGRRGGRWLRLRCEPVIRRSHPEILPAAASGNFPADVPIDIVYTWVDGSDPIHVRARRHWAEQLGIDPADALNPERFTDNGELKLSLRSLEAFLPWVRSVFLVTNGQVPHWLNADHPRIRLVPHESIFPDPGWLPTFNSHAIEFQLHRIPGLSEHFIYCNDDMFFGNPCNQEDFFTVLRTGDGSAVPHLQFANCIVPAYLYHPRRQGHTRLWQQVWNNLQTLLEQDFPGHRVRAQFLHQATPLRKSLLARAAALSPDLYAAVSASKFRSAQDIPPIGLACHLGLIRQEAVLRPISECSLKGLQGVRDFLANGPPAKLCCIHSLCEGIDVCESIAELAFCRTPSSFEKRSSHQSRADIASSLLTG